MFVLINKAFPEHSISMRKLNFPVRGGGAGAKGGTGERSPFHAIVRDAPAPETLLLCSKGPGEINTSFIFLHFIICLTFYMMWLLGCNSRWTPKQSYRLSRIFKECVLLVIYLDRIVTIPLRSIGAEHNIKKPRRSRLGQLVYCTCNIVVQNKRSCLSHNYFSYDQNPLAD